MDPKTNGVVHFEMPMKDKARTIKFYESAFNWKMMGMGEEMGNYVVASTTDSTDKGPKNPGAINGGFYPLTEGMPTAPSVVIQVANLDESIKKVEEAGGKILDKPMDIPQIGRYVAFEDTEGNRVGMLQPVAM